MTKRTKKDKGGRPLMDPAKRMSLIYVSLVSADRDLLDDLATERGWTRSAAARACIRAALAGRSI